MRPMAINNLNDYLYVGQCDSSTEKIIVTIDLDEPMHLDIKEAVSNHNVVMKFLSITDLIEICRLSDLKATIFPNGNISLRKLDSSNDELKTCYLTIVKTMKCNCLLCIAFDETQPTLYKAQLVSVFLLDTI